MIEDLKRTGLDELVREYVLAKKIIRCTEGVTDGHVLLESTSGQPTTGACPVAGFSTEKGKKAALLLDFGCEFAGGVQIVTKTGSKREGLKVRIRFGESASEAMTPSGEKGACNDHSVRDMEVLLPWNSAGSFGQTGYRFLYLELLEPESWLELVSVQGIFTYRKLPYLGSFTCNDDVLNRIFDTCAYTVHLNMQQMLWDGIKRDRLVWIGDMHPEMLAIRTVFGDQRIVDDCLKYIPVQHPLPGWPNHLTTYGMWYILILWDWYFYNGRKELLYELAEYWKALLEQLAGLVHEEEGGHLREEEFEGGFFLDWPTRGQKDAKAGIYALLSLALTAGARLCGAVGEAALAEKYENKAGLLKQESLSVHDRKQVAAMMTLAGLLSREESAECLKRDGGKGMSTFMSFYILKAAAKTAGMEDALNMLRQYYGGMLQAGATTFWEDFDLDWLKEGASIEKLPEAGEYDIHGDNGRFCYTGFRHSLCHGWSSGPAAFLAEEVMGIRILEPGCRRVSIKPQLGELQWAVIRYPTPYGILHMKAWKDGETTRVDIDAPKGMEIVAEKEGKLA